MKIKNDTATTVYMGYEGMSGFHLGSGQTSHDVPVSLLENPFLKKDYQDGRIDIIGVDIPWPRNPAPPQGQPVAPATTPPKAPPAPGLDLIENDIRAMLGRMSATEDKVKYLEELKKDGNGRAKKLADKLLAEITQVTVTSADTPKSVSPAPKLQDPQPPSNVEASVDDKSPQVNLGNKPRPEGDDLDGMGMASLVAMSIRMGLKVENAVDGKSPTYKSDVLRTLIREAREKAQPK